MSGHRILAQQYRTGAALAKPGDGSRRPMRNKGRLYKPCRLIDRAPMLDLAHVAEPHGSPIDPPPAMQRARGRARIALRFDEGATRLWQFYQEGCCKIRLPRPEPGRPMEAVLLNTSGGITGGDRLEFEVDLGEGTEAVVTTQAAERIYRSPAGPGFVFNRLTVANGATLDWLPQETILFDRSGLDRRLEVDLAGDATALLAETIVFGRGAMGETVRTLSLADRWRVRRDGRLIFADGIVLDGDAATILTGGATGGGATAIGSLLYAATDARAYLGPIRDVIADCASEAGASAWPGVLNMRFVAQSSQILRQDLRRVAEALRGRPLPRVWHC
jgi:urease accessory protein